MKDCMVHVVHVPSFNRVERFILRVFLTVEDQGGVFPVFPLCTKLRVLIQSSDLNNHEGLSDCEDFTICLWSLLCGLNLQAQQTASKQTVTISCIFGSRLTLTAQKALLWFGKRRFVL